MLPRLIRKEQAKIVAAAGGVIGVWTHLSTTALEYAQNIQAMVDVAGIDHVCIGTDTKMTKPYRSPTSFEGQERPDNPNNHKDEPSRDSNNGKKDLNSANDSGRTGERTNEAWQYQKAGFYYAVVDAMLKTGFKEDEIGKIGGGNFCRIFNAATAGH